MFIISSSQQSITLTTTLLSMPLVEEETLYPSEGYCDILCAVADRAVERMSSLAIGYQC